jgi:ATP-dependent DNA ligase
MPLPRWIEPQLSMLAAKAPTGPQWVHEIKFDGYRMAARIEKGHVQLLTRSGLDWTEKYPMTAAALAQLKVNTAYIDGELCGVRADGVTSFEIMQQVAGSGGGHLTYFAFDLLYLDGEDVARLSLAERKARDWRPFSRSRRQGLPIAITKAAMAKPFAGPRASMASKASSRSGSIAPICPAIAARGLRANASTGPSSSLSGGRIPRAPVLFSGRFCSATTSLTAN